MAKQKGLIKLKGTMGNITFYKGKDGYSAKEKSEIDKSRILTSPSFARTRENGAEFANSARAGKYLRDAVRPMMQNASDSRVTSRLTKVMSAVKNLDLTSVRGSRNVATGIGSVAGKAELQHFNFNIEAILQSIVYKPIDLDLTTGQIMITELLPSIDVAYPSGATHMSLRGAWARVDFATGKHKLKLTNTVNLHVDDPMQDVILTPTSAPTIVGTNVHLLMVEFFQEVNGVQYSLKNGLFNALTVLEVA